jgi:hypothetical protein
MLEAERQSRVHATLKDMYKQLTELEVFPSLVWTWVYDIIRSFENDSDYKFLMTEEQWFDLLWNNVDKANFSLTYGDEQIYEDIRDWLLDNDVMVDVLAGEEDSGDE